MCHKFLNKTNITVHSILALVSPNNSSELPTGGYLLQLSEFSQDFYLHAAKLRPAEQFVLWYIISVNFELNQINS